MTALLLLTILSLLTVGLMLVSIVGAGRERPRDLRSRAEEKGFVLLRSWLTPEQKKQWMRVREFEVIGCDTGKRYRIMHSGSMNVCELDQNGLNVMRWCFVPAGLKVTGDILLAQKIALETMEHRALAVANRCRPL
jgi:hypothetical protein